MRMLRKCYCRCARNRSLVLVAIAAALFLYGEVFVYWLARIGWSDIVCDNRRECTRILLVADPQIIGLYNDGAASFLTKFDSDKYLRSTYIRAYDHTAPDLVIFLGDLTDEGSRAEHSEFLGYVRRFFRIFPSVGPAKHIWISGDNDIGGEGADIVSNQKTGRFGRAFAQADIIRVNNITFVKINRLTHTFPSLGRENGAGMSTTDIIVGVSHVPLLFQPAPFVDNVLAAVQPHLLFTAHEHKSMVVLTDAVVRQDRRIIPIRSDDGRADRVRSFPLASGDICEVLVPTCNYRMGTMEIGYGFAVIENNELKYTVLWSPSRYHNLGLYLIVIVVLLLYFVCGVCLKCGQKAPNRLRYYSQP